MRTVRARDLDIGDGYPPRIMGVVNLSPDSPYAPSVFTEPSEAARYVDDELVTEGADIVDIGLETANKRFEVKSAEWELDRLDLAIETAELISSDPVLSIETRYHEVADEALSRGFDMVNDICGFADPALSTVCEAHDAAVVKMASPPDLTRPGAFTDADEIYEGLKRGGLTEQTIVDPAFGGWSAEKTLADDHETFRRLREFRALGHPILISINRKNFLGDLVGRETPDRLPVSLAATAIAVERGVHVIRTHDVSDTRDAAIVGAYYARDRVGTDRVEEVDVTTVREAARYLDRFQMDPALATDSVLRVFVVRAVGPDESAVLESHAQTSGALIATSGSTVYLAGTPRVLTDVVASIEGDAPDIADGLAQAL